VPVLLRELGSEEAPNKRNAAFCAAMLCTASGVRPCNGECLKCPNVPYCTVLYYILAGDECNKRNAAFCAAMLCTASGGQAVQR